VDGNVSIVGASNLPTGTLRPGDLVRCLVIGSEGIDLVATALEVLDSVPGNAVLAELP
jgi:hypothetical protein